ncbi:MAG: hypothetical protein QM703_26985 [Gemmatales bacterium]
MPTTTQLIAAYHGIADRHQLTNPDRILCSPRLRREFLSELGMNLNEEDEAEAFHQLLNLRKRKALKKPSSLQTNRRIAS